MVPSADDERVTSLDLVSSERRLDHGLGRAIEDLAAVGVFPSEIGLDVAVLAALVHAADTRISRKSESQDTWTREIRLVVPTSDPALWHAAAGRLTRMLNFLTGDLWTLEFRARPADFKKTIARPTKPVIPGFDRICLFSGGVDSLVGGIDVLDSGGFPLFVSHAGDGSTSNAQNECFEALSDHYKPRALHRLRVWMTFPNGLVDTVGSEKTTRGRSFLFISLGVLAATGLSSPFSLCVPENGLIALNVPLDMLRLGSLSTRTTHPFFLACWNEVLRILGMQGRVDNQYWDKTKGEAVAGCRNPSLLKRIVPSSLSCASPTKGRWQGRGIEHCGYCLPCLIRRAALDAAWGHGEDPTTYTLANLHDRPLNTLTAEGQQVRSLELATARLKARPELARFLIHKQGPLPPDRDYLQALTGVFSRGLAEVGAFIDGARTRPW